MSEATVAFSSPYSSLSRDVTLGEEPVAKTLSWAFDRNEAEVETTEGWREISRLDIDVVVSLQPCPSQLGRLFSYETEDFQVASVNHREWTLPDGQVVRATISSP